jgi:NitT/TauT family transport system substrate-binding protein
MVLKDNIVTDEVRKNGFGRIDNARFDQAVDQIALTYTFKNAKPKAADVFDASFLPGAADLKFN